MEYRFKQLTLPPGHMTPEEFEEREVYFAGVERGLKIVREREERDAAARRKRGIR